MSIIHIKRRENPFVQIDKRVFEDPRIKWKSKGILGYLLTKPHDWEVSISDIVKKSPEGIDLVRDALQDLKKYGYASLELVKNEDGSLGGKRWVVCEEPNIENTDIGKIPISGKSDIGKIPISGKSNTSNNELESNNKKESNNEKNSEDPEFDSKNDQTTNSVEKALNLAIEDLREKSKLVKKHLSGKKRKIIDILIKAEMDVDYDEFVDMFVEQVLIKEGKFVNESAGSKKYVIDRATSYAENYIPKIESKKKTDLGFDLTIYTSLFHPEDMNDLIQKRIIELIKDGTTVSEMKAIAFRTNAAEKDFRSPLKWIEDFGKNKKKFLNDLQRRELFQLRELEDNPGHNASLFQKEYPEAYKELFQ